MVESRDKNLVKQKRPFWAFLRWRLFNMLHFPHLVPKVFWPYTSGVMYDGIILQTEYSNGDIFDKWRDELIELFRAHDIKAHTDNKIVFEFWDPFLEMPLYIGFYDLKMSIGRRMRSDHPKGITAPKTDDKDMIEYRATGTPPKEPR